ncbi:uncharacterized protein LOC100575222 [Acyrthosiphon pisum]|uniref:Uncharacterized protein n=1 Tax=Acyrthosiphon pisum TaxID=7029 RepID=A0A8R2JKY1_ACYPI|nr:uncharacterized protein LOC100575222 [Acyrthosiphon pisum]
MAGVFLSTIESFNLKICNLRGQSYDNASNMSGIYSGLQAKIKAVSPLAQFVPCSAHSLNLVGANAASSCKNAVMFFDLLQKLYTFFSASTYRWDILKSSVKSLSDTRRSARDDAFAEIYQSLICYVNDLRTDSEYEYYKKLAIEKCGIEDFVSTKKRTKNRKTFIDDGPTIDDSNAIDFKVTTYLAILDRIQAELIKRKKCI